jgi:hypothetical protein
MLSTLVLLAGLMGPAQSDGLSLTDVRLTLGISGPPRASAKLLPGDNLIVSFDITGITADDEGKVRYSIATELTDATGKVLFRQLPREQSTTASLGGGILPAFAQVDVGLEQPAGDYKLKVTVTDVANSKSQSFTQNFSVVPKAFGLVRLSASFDPDGQLPASLPVAGQTIWLHLAAVGYERAKKEANSGGQPNVTLEVRILDEQGKPTTVKPISGTINKDVPEKAVALPLQFPVMLNRAGKFTLKLTANDKLSGKSVEYSAPLVVRPHR